MNPFARPAANPPPPPVAFPPPPNPFAQPAAYPPPPPPPQAVNPFAAPAYPPPPPPQAVNPFGPQIPTAVNPFAAAPTTAAIGAPPLTPAVQPIASVRYINVLRPFTVVLAIAAIFYMFALLYATSVAGGMKVVTTRSAFSDLVDAMGRAEKMHLLALAFVILATIAWWYRAAGNARRLCADKPRYSPHTAWTFLIPLLNVIVVGNAFEDISKHSHERARPVEGVVRAFRIAVLATLLLRLVLYLVNSGQIRGIAAQDAAFYVLGFNDPARFIWAAGPEAGGFTVVVSLACAIVPVLAILAAVSIERAQVEAHRRMLASAI